MWGSVHLERAYYTVGGRTRPPRVSDFETNLAPQRERPPELDPDLRPRLRAPVRVQHHAQDAVDAEPGVPEGVGVAFSVHLVFGHGVGAPLSTASRTRAERESDGTVQVT